MTLVDKIKKLCDERGISLKQLESVLGFGNGSLAKSKTIKSDRILELANFFNVSTDYLLKEDAELGEVPVKSSMVSVKVLGRVAAGVPIEAIEDVIGEETISPELASTGEFFGLRISGESMEPLIHHGSVVIVREQEDVENGEIAIVVVNGNDATCKKIEKYSNGIMLVPINKEYNEKFYSNEEIESLPVNIIGKVIEARAKF